MDVSVLYQLSPEFLVPGVSLLEKIIRPTVIYFFLALLLRLGGLRELAQLNTFDLVVLLILSNTVQNAIIGNDNSLTGGIIGGIVLIALNWVVTRFLYRHPALEQALEVETVELVKDGRVLRKNLEQQLITESELIAAIHRQGVGSIEECASVRLEMGGTISVIPRDPSAAETFRQDIVNRLDRIERLLTPGPEQSRIP